jgi:transposase
MLADELDYVIGVDTHRDEHVLAVLTAAAGAVVAGEALPANARGYRETLRFAGRFAAGRRAWAIEGIGSYGAGLARFLAGRGETVLEVSRTPPSGDYAAKTTPSTRPGQRVRHSPATRSRCRAPARGGRRCGCCLSLVEAPSTSAAKGSRSCVA